MSRKLTVVPDDAVAVEDPKTVREAADHSERALLVALRTRIASDIDAGVPPHTLAPLSRQLREIDREIRGLDARAAEEAAEGDGATPDGTWEAI